MFKSRFFLQRVWLTLSVVFLLSCTPETFSPPHGLVGFRPNVYLNVAVDSSGRRHIVGETTAGKLGYLRTAFIPAEEPVEFTHPPGYAPTPPDLGVLQDGRAVLAWAEQYYTTMQYRLCRLVIPTSGFFFAQCNPLHSEEYLSYPSGVPPLIQVATGSEKAYIIYSKESSGVVNLYYKQVAGSGSVERKVSSYTTYHQIGAISSGVDAGGYLHVLWSDISIGSEGVYYASSRNMDSSGNMAYTTFLIGPTDPLYPPGLAFFSQSRAEKVVVAYIQENPGADDRLWYRTFDTSGPPSSVGTEVPLSTLGRNWGLEDVHVVGTTNRFVIGFIGRCAGLPNNEIWVYDSAVGNVKCPDTVNSDKQELEMVGVETGSGMLPVLAYKRAAPAAAFIFDDFHGERVVLSESSGPTCRGSGLASNGTLVAGVWAGYERAWYSTSAYSTFIPAVMK